MRPTRAFLARPLAAAILLAWAALLPGVAAAGAVVVTIDTYAGGVPPEAVRFTPPFDIDPFNPPSTGVNTAAVASASRNTRLPTGPNGSAQNTVVTDYSGWQTTSTPGQTVQVAATLENLQAPLLGSAVAGAMSTPYESHAYAATVHRLRMWNANEVTVAGTTHAVDTLWVLNRQQAEARSGWFRTWTAVADGTADIKLALDGHLGFSAPCQGAPNCVVSMPEGVDAVQSVSPYRSLRASFAVYDLSVQIFCPEQQSDDCGNEDVPHPLPVVSLRADYQGFDFDDLPFDFEDEWILGLNATAGHRYMVLGQVEVVADSGGHIDFFNTMRVKDVNVLAGVLREDATGRDLASLFDVGTPGTVPEPGSAALLLLGAAAAVQTGRRRRAAAADVQPGRRLPAQ